RGILPADHLHDLAVTHLREAAAAVLRRRRHAQHADPRQPVDDGTRNVGVAVNGRRVDLLRHEVAHLVNGAVHLRLLGGVELRIWEQQGSIEVAEEESLGKAERLRSGKEYFFRLPLLLLELCGGQSHVVRSAEMGSRLFYLQNRTRKNADWTDSHG